MNLQFSECQGSFINTPRAFPGIGTYHISWKDITVHWSIVFTFILSAWFGLGVYFFSISIEIEYSLSKRGSALNIT